jgi:hypothetical protein
MDIKKIRINDTAIANNFIDIEKNIKTYSYFLISKRLSKSIQRLDYIMMTVNNYFVKNKSNLFNDFKNESLISEVIEDNNIKKIKDDLFELSDYINKSNYRINSNIDSLIPIQNNIINLTGNSESFEFYLFKKKPTAIIYTQLERLKLLLVHNQLLYQESILNEINIIPTYYKNSISKLKLDSLNNSKIDTTNILNNSNNISQSSYNILERKNKIDLDTNSKKYISFIKNILSSLNTENIFVGLNHTLFTKNISNDFSFEITPKTNIFFKTNNNVDVIFNKEGRYNIRFFDKNKENIVLFEKYIYAIPLPDPIVKVKDDNFSYTISIKNLLKNNRLEPILKVSNFQKFPGRINSFRLIKISNGKESDSIINYGELFQIPTQKLINNLKIDDFIIFNDITLTLLDGTTRYSNSIMYKIIK